MPPAFHFDADTLDPRNRGDGVSAILRVRDGAQFLRPGLQSCIDVFDEIIAVHHQCSDDTPQILHEYAAAYPDRFKVYEYPHEVFPPHTMDHAREGPKSPHTIAALCNYALSKTTRRYVVKHDADHVYFPRFAHIVEAVRARNPRAGAVLLSGVNLARSRAGDIGVWLQNPICGTGDFLFFPVSRDTYFVHDGDIERLIGAARPHTYAGVSFWHLKMLQKHYGLREYRWSYEDNYAELRRRCRAIEDSLEVVPLAQFIALFSGVDSRFIDRHCHNPLWRNRITRAFAWRLAKPLARWPMLNRVRYLHLLLSFRLEQDMCGVSLPPEHEWTGTNDGPEMGGGGGGGRFDRTMPPGLDWIPAPLRHSRESGNPVKTQAAPPPPLHKVVAHRTNKHTGRSRCCPAKAGDGLSR